jgi:HAD superfamily hydrolase (TIGR01458 family)
LPDRSVVAEGAGLRSIRGLLVDIDGTLHVAGRPIAGAAVALDALRSRIPFLFTTNTSRMPRTEVAAVLDSMGFETREDEVLTATVAAALRLREAGVTRVQLLAPQSVMRDFSAFEITEAAPEAVVVADLGAGFTFEVLNSAFRSLLEGARLVAIHRNRYWITEAGPTLDAGPFVAALEVAAQTEAELVGKPAPAFFEMAAATLGVPLDGLADSPWWAMIRRRTSRVPVAPAFWPSRCGPGSSTQRGRRRPISSSTRFETSHPYSSERKHELLTILEAPSRRACNSR